MITVWHGRNRSGIWGNIYFDYPFQRGRGARLDGVDEQAVPPPREYPVHEYFRDSFLFQLPVALVLMGEQQMVFFCSFYVWSLATERSLFFF